MDEETKHRKKFTYKEAQEIVRKFKELMEDYDNTIIKLGTIVHNPNEGAVYLLI